METKSSSTAVAKTEQNGNGNVKVLHEPIKNVELILGKLATVKSAEKNYLFMKSRVDELGSLTFLEGNNNQALVITDAEGNRFMTNNPKMLGSVKQMLISEAEQRKCEVENYLLNATLA